MSIHKLTAGSGYDYLTRQVAALDGTDKGRTSLATYYTEKGETPGMWVGSGISRIEGLAVGEAVTADQMRSLFGSGHHPLAVDRSARLSADATVADHVEATRLGAPFKVYADDLNAFQSEVAARIRASSGGAAATASQRADVRTQVAREWFLRAFGREPADARELSALVAREARPRTTAVAGFDLTFSPVKSVSTLWALADEPTAAQVERAHRAAVGDALRYVENRALFTRLGTNGVRQVDVRGLVATAFTHRDSRAGDPDLHTHVAISNKVQTLDGRWRAIDGRTLYAATVSVSEVYNTALERHLDRLLGLEFRSRHGNDPAKRTVREVVGVDPTLNQAFSKRRMHVDRRRDELVGAFQQAHGRSPSPVETIHLAQQATLETRDAKHAPRTLLEQRRTWRGEAVSVLGSAEALQTMLAASLGRRSAQRATTRDLDVEACARRTVAAVERSRATWTTWHIYAEAQRQVRDAAPTSRTTSEEVMRQVDEVTAAALDHHSVRVSRLSADDTTSGPHLAAVRRADGTDAYVMAGSSRFTSARILAAERRLVSTAGQEGAHVVPPEDLEQALQDVREAGGRLNDGQEELVRAMASSGRRLQLAIAPAGSGKTTAMEALAAAWRAGGGSVIGLAPSAAAADALRRSLTSAGAEPGTASFTDTLAKLVHSVESGTSEPTLLAGIDAKTLVIIDEAGMAATITLDRVVAFLVGRGATIRMVGDDQQLTAIGAGGVLRDIKTTHGALHLDELVRFADPAEGAASLALREGRQEALGFYLDNNRVHVGDLPTVITDVFEAWRADRAAGSDALMVAPTRALVADLNHRARTSRLETATPTSNPAAGGSRGSEAALADGNHAGLGDIVITRTNDRRLVVGQSDWVKNGDRWLVTAVVATQEGPRLTVRHLGHRCTATLPPDYVRESTALGYACTIHAAQGVTADTVHGVATGAESRQQLYTMLTRGRRENHVHLVTVGTGDEHDILKPDVTHPRTATDVLGAVLARDEAHHSATSAQRDAADPAVRLGSAADRYVDGIHLAAEHALLRSAGPHALDELDRSAEAIEPGLSHEAAWPALRSHLALSGLSGADPSLLLRRAVAMADLDGARDRAAVVDWRLAEILPTYGAGPLPWLPPIPLALADDLDWGGYLRDLEGLVTSLATRVEDRAKHSDERPSWVTSYESEREAVVDVTVWRAATHVEPDDQRPTGPVQMTRAAARYQRGLMARITRETGAAAAEWEHLLRPIAPQILTDAFSPALARRLSAVSRAGLPAHELLNRAAAVGPLPDEHAAAALWWRIARHLTPPVAAHVSQTPPTGSEWETQLVRLFGVDRALAIRASSWWPALVVNVRRGFDRGWALEELVGESAGPDESADECLQLVWQSTVALDPIPVDPEEEPPPDPMDQGPPVDLGLAAPTPWSVPATQTTLGDDPVTVLARAAILREATRLAGPCRDPSDAEVRRMYRRQEEWDHSPVDRQRMIDINAMAQACFETGLKSSWVPPYLTQRLGVDISGDPRFGVGHAPDGWTTLVDHLRAKGVSETELVATGVATLTKSNRLIDRFRDRMTFPIVNAERPQEILGFVARRNPDCEAGHSEQRMPKYLNTATTPLFHKGDQLFGAHLGRGSDSHSCATPVLVEGPVDAIAVTLATAERFVGVSSLGTALSEAQATQIATIYRTAEAEPVIATDSDLAGLAAAERAFRLLAPHGLDATVAHLDAGSDPASTFSDRGAAGLAGALVAATPLGAALFANLTSQPQPDVERALTVLSARPAESGETASPGSLMCRPCPQFDSKSDSRLPSPGGTPTRGTSPATLTQTWFLASVRPFPGRSPKPLIRNGQCPAPWDSEPVDTIAPRRQMERVYVLGGRPAMLALDGPGQATERL